jgi:hypothetical protein
VRAVLDPLTLTPLRNAVIHSAWGRGKKDLPPGIEKKLRETRVVTNVDPIAPPFRRDIATSMKVDRINEKTRDKQFKVRDERQSRQGGARVDDSRRPENLEDRRGQQRQIERAMQQAQAERAAQANKQQAQGERVGQPERSKPRDVGRSQLPNVQRPPRINERKPIEHGPGQVKQPRVQQQPRQAVDRGRGSMKVDRAPQASAAPRQEKQQAKPQAGGGGKGGKPAANPRGQGGGKGKKP